MVIKKWQPNDLDNLYSVYSDKELLKWMRITQSNYINHGYGIYIVYDINTDEHVGCIGLINPPETKDAEVKYIIKEKFSGQSRATELLESILTYTFNTLDLIRVFLTIDIENKASQRVALKAGMTLESIWCGPDPCLIYSCNRNLQTN